MTDVPHIPDPRAASAEAARADAGARDRPATAESSDDASWRSGPAVTLCLMFLVSMAAMVVELTAARLVAQHLGVSLYTWTAVIGVVLAGLSLGYFVGGHLADVWVARGLLPTLCLGSSVLCLSILFVVESMGQTDPAEWMPWSLWTLQNIAKAFLLPSVLLGTLPPVLIRRALQSGGAVGDTIGRFYSIGTLGSIVGTLVTGYVLIDAFGAKSVICGTAVGLAALGLFLSLDLRPSPAPFHALWLWIAVVLSTLSVGPWPWAEQWGYFLGLRLDTSYLDYYDESAYFTIEVYEATELDDTRVLALDHLVHSYVALDDVTRLEYPYETVYASITQRYASDGPFRALFIGGGGYTFPRYLEHVYPAAAIDVAEIDPAVKLAAQEALLLPPDDETVIRTHSLDARIFIEDRARANANASADSDADESVLYDFVYGDAFNDFSVPYHLTTRGFNDRLRELLTPDGIYMVNIIDIYRDGLGGFLGAYVNTAVQTFPYVYVFSGEPDGTSEDRDTFVVVSALRELRMLDLGSWPYELSHQGTLFAWSEEGVPFGEMETVLRRGRGIVLTDDYAPVDNLLAPVFATQ